MSHQTVASYTKITEERVHRKLAAGKKTTKTDWAAGDRCAEIERKTVHNTAAACLHYKTLHICYVVQGSSHVLQTQYTLKPLSYLGNQTTFLAFLHW